MTLGERILARRKSLNYSRKILSKITGVSTAQMARYETDFAKPTADAIIALAKGLEVTPNWLLGVDEALPDKTDLTEMERKALAFLRSQPPEKHAALLELWRVATRLL